MHKYKPRVHVMEQDSRIDLSRIQSLPAEGVKTFTFKETEFTTVTAYQNQQVKPTRSQASKDGPRGTFGIEANCTIRIEFFTIKKSHSAIALSSSKFDHELCGSCVRKESTTKSARRERT